jgi:preprotein translocase subunit SecG
MIHLKYRFVRNYNFLPIFEEDYVMHAVAITLLVIVSIALIVVVLLQSGKSAGLSGAISGGAEQLFGKQKARGIDAVLHRITIVLSVLFFILTVAVTYLDV